MEEEREKMRQEIRVKVSFKLFYGEDNKTEMNRGNVTLFCRVK